jgi:hypothetical protein
VRRSGSLLLRAGAVPALAVALAACSADEGGDDAAPPAASSSSGTAASPSGSAAPQAGSEFCTRSRELLEGLGAAFTDQADPASVEGAFERTAEGFRAVEPPAEIEQDWTALADGLEEYAAAFAELDETDPESVADFQQRTGTLQGELTGAATAVESYLAEECGIAGSSGTAAPSS